MARIFDSSDFYSLFVANPLMLFTAYRLDHPNGHIKLHELTAWYALAGATALALLGASGGAAGWRAARDDLVRAVRPRSDGPRLALSLLDPALLCGLPFWRKAEMEANTPRWL